GGIALQVTAGNLAIDAITGGASAAAVGSASGTVSLVANGLLTLSGSVQSTGGSISLRSATASVTLAAGAAIATGGAGTLDVQAQTDVNLADGSVLRTDGGNVRVQAVAGTLTLGLVDARTSADRSGTTLTQQSATNGHWGDVSLLAGTSVLDNASEAIANAVDVYARNLRLVAGSGSLGVGSNALETEAALLSAAAATAASGGVFLTEATALTVGTVADLSVDRIGLGSTGTQTDAATSAFTSGGALVLTTLAGSLSVNSAASAGANLLLQAGGAASDL
ncbi:hypothetical protein, partial [Pseudacidovorax intermedius]